MRKVFIIVCCIVTLAACSKDKVRISGNISHASDSMLYLDEVDVYKSIPLDSVNLRKSGRFSFKIDANQQGFYQLRLSPDRIVALFPSPGENIKVQADAFNMVSSLNVSGSHETEQITKLIKMLTETRKEMDSVAVIYEKTSDTVRLDQLKREYNNILDLHRKASIAYILTHYNSLTSVYALYQQYLPGYFVFYKTTDLQYFKIISDSLSKYHPKSKHAQALRAYANNRLSSYKAEMLMEHPGIKVSQLPSVELPDYAGDTIALSSLKSRYVLLSFWVSGNQSCVKNNLDLKKIYQQYSNRGFEIFQVSFDNSAEAWQRAVRFDELPWISVIDQGSNSVIAGNYNITQLPANYLIDNNRGSILGKNLTPIQLQSKLQELLN